MDCYIIITYLLCKCVLFLLYNCFEYIQRIYIYIYIMNILMSLIEIKSLGNALGENKSLKIIEIAKIFIN